MTGREWEDRGDAEVAWVSEAYRESPVFPPINIYTVSSVIIGTVKHLFFFWLYTPKVVDLTSYKDYEVSTDWQLSFLFISIHIG